MQPVAVAADPLLDRTVEQHREVLALGTELLLLDAGRAAHRAAGTVGTDDVAGLDPLLGAVVDGPDPD